MHVIEKSSAVQVLVWRRLDQALLCKPVPSQRRETCYDNWGFFLLTRINLNPGMHHTPDKMWDEITSLSSNLTAAPLKFGMDK